MGLSPYSILLFHMIAPLPRGSSTDSIFQTPTNNVPHHPNDLGLRSPLRGRQGGGSTEVSLKTLSLPQSVSLSLQSTMVWDPSMPAV